MNGIHPALEQTGQRLGWRRKEQILWVEPWGADSIRVRATMNAAMPELPWSLLPATATRAEVRGARLINGKLTAEVDADGRVSFFKTATGELLTAEIPVVANFPANREFKARGGELWKTEVSFCAFDDERIYGLGQRRHGLLDQKGCVLELCQRNAEINIPWLVSNRGYGVLWNHPGIGRVELGRTKTRWVAEAARLVDYVVTTGDSNADIVERYADLTGHAPVIPEWATGFWQCKLRYKTQAELLAVAREHKRRGLPMSVIVIDYFNWSKMGDWKFDPQCWPDPAAMVRELESLGIKLMVSIWPTVNPDSENFAELQRRGLLVRAEHGANTFLSFPDSNTGGRNVDLYLLDATHPEARRFIWDKVRENYYRHGIKAWWLDAIEPELPSHDHANVRYHLGNGLEVGGIYPQMQEQAFHDGMTAAGESEVLTLCRSAFAGSQRFGAAVWSGDIYSTFEVLAGQIRAGLNMAMSGIPWWTTDIGGFFGGQVQSEYFRELIVRWFQFGVFCPIFRLHGWRDSRYSTTECSDPTTGGPNEVWSFGDKAYGIIRELLFLRERLRPYIMEQMRVASAKGAPVMRPLFFDFPDDPLATTVEDQFMFGPDILVAPVVQQGATKRSVYLPASTEWTEAWTGVKIAGGQRIEVAAPLERIPVFVRAAAPIKQMFQPQESAG
jgi:alpha-D-xyloside xylohydrolase